MKVFNDGDIVQEFDGHGHPVYKEGRPVLRTCVSYENYKTNLEKFGDLKYVTDETCKKNPKRFKKLEVGFRPYRLSDEMNTKELVIVQELTKELEYNQSFLEQIAAVENTDDKYLSERERQIVLSTIQWMGTHVGECFLARVMLNVSMEKEVKESSLS